MTLQFNSRAFGTSHMPQSEITDLLDAFLIDDEFDDDLDRQIFAIRELADFRNL